MASPELFMTVVAGGLGGLLACAYMAVKVLDKILAELKLIRINTAFIASGKKPEDWPWPN